MVVDDICDGGRTFMGLGELIKEQTGRKPFLYVTHGIFSYNSLPKLVEIYSDIFVAHDVRNGNTNQHFTQNNV
jgi:ribose-phosphate pyrophosphokinase